MRDEAISDMRMGDRSNPPTNFDGVLRGSGQMLVPAGCMVHGSSRLILFAAQVATLFPVQNLWIAS